VNAPKTSTARRKSFERAQKDGLTVRDIAEEMETRRSAPRR
jgi:hypothetical protein